ncbi:MAG TPA: tRNA (N(6)-L-threonylcarbamoyladenosine(37)-C(2))-methylthiotransferase MtaB [Candidatus Hydrogenedentes bacterium]|nr:tRNA (N(6)-L-threonylcarbamoyladenosine(37)-C(2))-methylthiotransferase MtaB [Candidatus Hydrogenedentota bacterium]
MMQKRACVYTVGCRLNQAESGIIEDKLRDAGYVIVPFGNEADVGIINTCTVTREADAKCRQAVRSFIRKNPMAYTAVVGCYSQLAFKTLAEIRGVDLIIGTQEKLNVVNYITDKKNPIPVVVRDTIQRDDFTIDASGYTQIQERTNLKIQDGCDFMCAFCAIPFARGRARSRQFRNTLEEARQLVDSGVREIILTGVNIGMYRSENYTLCDVVDALAAIPGLTRIRVSSIEPTTIPEGLLDRMVAYDHPLVPFLHIPAQSGSNRILELMKRRYSREDFLEFIQLAVNKVPDLCIGTDLMVGFPGETDEDFWATYTLLKESPIAYAHVFKYSERRNTAASRMVDKVSNAVQDKRSALLRELSSEKRSAFHEKFVGRIRTVLFESEVGDGLWCGHTDNYITVLAKWKDGKANTFVPVRIQKLSGDHVIGSIENRNVQ